MKHIASFSRSEVVDTAYANLGVFPLEFSDWLSDNFHVWEAFVSEADHVIPRGFKHYSARTILHVLRHHYAIAESVPQGWKLNNNRSPYLARLFAILHPVHGGLFEFRETKAERHGL